MLGLRSRLRSTHEEVGLGLAERRVGVALAVRDNLRLADPRDSVLGLTFSARRAVSFAFGTVVLITSW